jgi:Tol biopolymer transport system component
MRRILLTALLAVSALQPARPSNLTPQKPNTAAHPYASDTPVNEPRVFAPGVVSTGDFESHLVFAPDGRTVYFLKDAPDFSFWTIVSSTFRKGRWSEPEVAPFSGRYSDADPFVTPDGSHLYFISTRPLDPAKGDAPKDLDIWVVERTPAGWGTPRNLGAPVNSKGAEWFPTVAANGTIYFGSDREGGRGRTDLYRARLVDGKYSEAENLGDPVNTQFNEFEPYIAPDESFLIFMGGGRAEGRGGFDLYVSYNREGRWTKPENLGDKINSPANEYSPSISPDGKYFFWTSTRGFGAAPLERRLTYRELSAKLHAPGNGLGDIYQIDLGALNIRR